MDRFMLDDVEDAFDAVEPLRPSSFDMSFTLSTSDGSFQDRRNPLVAADGVHRHTGTLTDAPRATENGAGVRASTKLDADTDADLGVDANVPYSRTSAAIQGRKTTLPHEQGRLNTEQHVFAGYAPQVDTGMKHTAGKRSRNVAGIAEKLEEKAQETMVLSNLVSKLSWKLTKRMQDVYVYRPSVVSEEDSNKIIFRVSCEVNANLHTIMEYLSPRDSKSYFDIESKVFPGLLHASVIKKMEIPRKEEEVDTATEQQGDENDKENHISPRTQTSSSGEDPLTKDLPRLQVKWHASRFAGRFIKPVDFFFVEYANVDTLPDGRKRGFGYVRSVESFKGDELATRLNSETVNIPPSVSKCKRAVINKGVFVVTPTGTCGHPTYEVAQMFVLDFQHQFSASVAQKIIANFTGRLLVIREQLYRTLFQPVALLAKSEWKDSRATRCVLCRAAFSFVKLRHHCRACGEAVCGQCSKKWVVQPHAPHATRLCTSCSLQARSNASSNMPRAVDLGSPSTNPFTTSMRVGSRGPQPQGGSSNDLLRATVRLPPASTATASSSTATASSSTERPHCDVRVASVLTSEADPAAAVRVAFQSLAMELGGAAPHLMIVSYSHFHDGHRLHTVLAEAAPNTLFMGGTSSGGVFTDSGAVDTGPALALWGIYDPEGSYAVLNADLTSETPRDATRRCLAAGKRLLCMEADDVPDVVWLSASSGTEEAVVQAANEALDCAVGVLGGGSGFVPTTQARYPPTQICSEGGELQWVTTHGLSFALCSPSVEVAHAFFTCYEPMEKTFVATKSLGRDIFTLDHKPAFHALNDSCRGLLSEFACTPQKYDLAKTKLPLYYPLARQRQEIRGAKLSRYQVLQPFQALEDGTLCIGGEVRPGDKLRVMSVSAETVSERLNLGFKEALAFTIPVVDAANVVGCVLSVSSNYPAIMNNETHGLAVATAKTFRNASVLGGVSTGQQGVLLGTTEAIHGNAMISALLITNRKKSFKLDPLRPVLLRRFSTY